MSHRLGACGLVFALLFAGCGGGGGSGNPKGGAGGAAGAGGTGPRERAVIAFFGVRGVGSLFYLVYALQAGKFAEQNALWRVVGLVVIGSILLHGVSASPIMWLLDRKRQRKARARHDETSRTHV